MDDMEIALRYTGPAVDSGVMDVYEASANMIAFSDFVVHAAKIAFGSTVETRAEVAGFGRGSFVTDLVFHVAGATATVFATIEPKTLYETLKDAFAVWKHLKGSTPAKVEYQGPVAQVTNNNGQILQVTIQSLQLVFSEKGSESAARFVHRALDREGMDAVELATRDGVLDRVTQAESKHFVAVAPTQTITDTTLRMGLSLESPVFKEDNKWRFSDGQHSFHAFIEDREFLARVDAGEAFRKGDVILADVRISQQQAGLNLTAERTIVKVHEHQSGPRQLPLT